MKLLWLLLALMAFSSKLAAEGENEKEEYAWQRLSPVPASLSGQELSYRQFNSEPAGDEPKEYTEEETGGAKGEAARFFILTFGSLPITFGLSAAVVAPSAPDNWSVNKKIGIAFASAASLSLSIAITDLIIGQVRKHRKAAEQQRAASQ